MGTIGGGAWYANTCAAEPEAGELMSDRREWIRSRARADERRCLRTAVRRHDSSARKPRGPLSKHMEKVPATAGSFTQR